jgi:hypothetical protein
MFCVPEITKLPLGLTSMTFTVIRAVTLLVLLMLPFEEKLSFCDVDISGTNPSKPVPLSVDPEADLVLLDAPLRATVELSLTITVRMSPTARARWSPKITAVGALSDQSEVALAWLSGSKVNITANSNR